METHDIDVEPRICNGKVFAIVREAERVDRMSDEGVSAERSEKKQTAQRTRMP